MLVAGLGRRWRGPGPETFCCLPGRGFRTKKSEWNCWITCDNSSTVLSSATASISARTHCLSIRSLGVLMTRRMLSMSLLILYSPSTQSLESIGLAVRIDSHRSVRHCFRTVRRTSLSRSGHRIPRRPGGAPRTSLAADVSCLRTLRMRQWRDSVAAFSASELELGTQQDKALQHLPAAGRFSLSTDGP